MSRLDNSHDVEIRKLLRVEVLILDDFALAAMDANDTATIYEIIGNDTAARRPSSRQTVNPTNG